MTTMKNSQILRTIPLLISVCLVSFPVQAKFAGGTGQPADPYQIALANQLISIRSDPNLLDKHFILVNDIDLDPNLPGGRVFTRAVIAPDLDKSTYSQETTFTGTFDGKGHKIRNLTIDANTAHDLGLFGNVGQSGRIHNLGLENVLIKGRYRIGSLVGRSFGVINNCHATGRITGKLMLGGLAGASGGSIINCHAAGSISGEENGSSLGGLVGVGFRGEITGCHATARVSGGRKSRDMGGLVGTADMGDLTISSCYATGRVSGEDNSKALGGLVGSLWMAVAIRNCYAMGYVSGGNNSMELGGFVGSASGVSITDCYASGSVTGGNAILHVGGFIGSVYGPSAIANCYSVGKLSVGNTSRGLGGLIGKVEGDELQYVHLSQCFWDVENSGVSESAGGKGLTTAQMQDIKIYQGAGWDLEGDRTDGTADIWQMPESGEYPQLTIFVEDYRPHKLAGSGTPENPYRIATAEDLGAVYRYDPSACYKLTDDVDLLGITWATAPIPDFDGTFEGNGHRIRHLAIRSDKPGYLGLFGDIGYNGRVKNLALEQVSITAGDDSFSLGGLAGSNGGNITSCYATGSITGGNESGPIGGMVGSNHTGIITNCYATTRVSAQNKSSDLGGLVGYSYMGTTTNCYATGRISAGKDSEDVGGLVGYSTDPISRCFWDVNTSGISISDSGTGLTTSQMHDIQTYLDAGWDMVGESSNGTADVWQKPKGVGYPELTVFSEGYRLHKLGGAGTLEDPFQIATAKDLSEIGNYNRSVCYKLVDDIDLSGIMWTNAPILDFDGEFDGAGFSILNLTIHGGNYLGLFGVLGEHATVKNLGIEDANIVAVDEAAYVGTLAGKSSATITNCHATGRVDGGRRSRAVGGLVGEVRKGTVIDCYATTSVIAKVKGSSVGGLVGYNLFGTIKRCYATGSVSGGEKSGSLAGLLGTLLYHGVVTDCYATGNVSGSEESHNIGGLVGDIFIGDTWPAYGSITNCYATGTVKGGKGSSDVGGLLGGLPDDVPDGFGRRWRDKIIHCYFLVPLDGGRPNNGYGMPLTDEQMKQQDSFVGWDFTGENKNGTEDIWWILEGQGYPRLRWELTEGNAAVTPEN